MRGYSFSLTFLLRSSLSLAAFNIGARPVDLVDLGSLTERAVGRELDRPGVAEGLGLEKVSNVKKQIKVGHGERLR
jgi:hypothetical protein